MGPVRKINNPKNQSIQRLCYGGDDLWKKSVIKFIKCGCEVLGRLVRLASCSVRPLPYPSSICEEQMGFRISFDYRLNSTVFWISNKTPIVYGRGNKAYFIILILLANNTIDAQNVIAFYHRFRPGGGGGDFMAGNGLWCTVFYVESRDLSILVGTFHGTVTLFFFF